MSTNLSEPSDYLPHKLLLAKLITYDFDESSLRYKNFLSDRKKRVKIIEQIFSTVSPKVKFYIPFNIFLCDLFLFLPNIDIASYTDDNIPYAMNKSTNEVVRGIKMAPEWLFT